MSRYFPEIKKTQVFVLFSIPGNFWNLKKITDFWDYGSCSDTAWSNKDICAKLREVPDKATTMTQKLLL